MGTAALGVESIDHAGGLGLRCFVVRQHHVDSGVVHGAAQFKVHLPLGATLIHIELKVGGTAI